MKKIVKISLGIVACILVFISMLVVSVITLSKPTKGDPIASYQNPKQAILVIDIQEDYTGTTAKPPFPYKDSEQLIAAVNKITETASKKDFIIVYIRQELDGLWGKMLSNLLAGGTVIKGNPGTEIDKRVSILSEHTLPKPKSDAFSNPELGELLIEHQVDELYLVGLDAAGCVHNTAKGALNRGYAVNIITDAVVLQDEEQWEELLNEYRQEGIILIESQVFLSGTHE